jgi:hypothetical protein
LRTAKFQLQMDDPRGDRLQDDDDDGEGGVGKVELRKLKAATHYHVAKMCEEEGLVAPPPPALQIDTRL